MEAVSWLIAQGIPLKGIPLNAAGPHILVRALQLGRSCDIRVAGPTVSRSESDARTGAEEAVPPRFHTVFPEVCPSTFLSKDPQFRSDRGRSVAAVLSCIGVVHVREREDTVVKCRVNVFFEPLR